MGAGLGTPVGSFVTEGRVGEPVGNPVGLAETGARVGYLDGFREGA